MKTADMPGALAAAIKATLISPNEADSNFEPANVVDGLFAIARAIDRLACAVEEGREDQGANKTSGGQGRKSGPLAL